MVLFMLSESKKGATTWVDITKKQEIVQCVKVVFVVVVILSLL